MSGNPGKGGQQQGQTGYTPNIGDYSSMAFQGAFGNTAAQQNLPAGQIADTDLTPYLNPFSDAVVARTMSELDRQRDIQRRDIGDRATAAGAFGGDRHGIAEAELDRNYADIQANTLANLFYGGFDTATGLAQTDIQNRLRSQLGNLQAADQLAQLSNLGFGQARAIQGDVMQSGAQQQLLQQALMDAARGQWAGLTGQPMTTMDLLTSGLSGIQVPSTTESGYEPGLFDYLRMGSGVAGAWLGGG